MTAPAESVGVIGAGIVGICAALEIQRAGFDVTLIDRDEPGMSCSYGNAGILTATEVGPLGLPGMMKNLPKWLLDPLGPVAVDPLHLPKMIPWGLRLLKESRPDRVEQIADQMQGFYHSAIDLYRDLLGSVGAGDLVRQPGYLCVYSSRETAQPDDYFWSLHRQRGIALNELGAGEIRQIVPDASKDLTYAIHVLDEGCVVSPLAVSKALLGGFLAEGGTFIEANVSHLEPTDGAVVVRSEAGDQTFSNVVLSAGVHSKRLARQLGDRVLLEAMRGYHAMIPNPAIDLKLPVMSGDYKFFASPMRDGLRIAGTAEFASPQKKPNYKRVSKIATAAERIFPSLSTLNHEPWMGNRPMTPDSLPIIGPATRHKNVLYAFGHGHNGLSGAPMTAKLLVSMMKKEPMAIDVAPFAAERFGASHS